MFRDMKDSEIFTRLTDFFGKKSEVLLVFLFGSAASRKMAEGSDIDIGILLNTSLMFMRLINWEVN